MSNNFCVKVGNNIRNYRKLADMTMKELAEKVGVTEATIQKYEAGNIKTVGVNMIQKLATALDVPPEKITGWGADAKFSKVEDMKKGGEDEASLIRIYRQLTDGHKKAVQTLTKNLLECQDKI